MSAAQNHKRPAPLSIRLSDAERVQLERDAAGLSLSAYVKERVFGEDVPKPVRRGKAPVKDHEALGKLLAQLGASRLASNMNQLAKAAHSGALPVTPETKAALMRACDDIAAMRRMLMQGLGMRLPADVPAPSVRSAWADVSNKMRP